MNTNHTLKSAFKGKNSIYDIYDLLENHFSEYDYDVKGISILEAFKNLVKEDSIKGDLYLSNKEDDLELSINAYGKINTKNSVEMHFHKTNYHDDLRFNLEFGVFLADNTSSSILELSGINEHMEVEYIPSNKISDEKIVSEFESLYFVLNKELILYEQILNGNH